MPKEFRVFGCPGTGKTTNLSEKIQVSCRKFGSQHVMVASFTKTAAVELTQRGLPLPPSNVGTLHSFCFRALGHPEIAEAPKHIREWNKWVDFPDWRLSGAGASLDDPYAFETVSGKTEGDSLLQSLSTLRTSLKERRDWPPDVRMFSDKWSAWKTETGRMDFTDLIALSYERCPAPPVPAIVGYFDEVQDFSPLELALIRQWGETMRFIVLGGDDDQCQPAGTKVLVEGGHQVNIEDLDPERHRLVSYDRRGSELVGFRRGSALKKAQNTYSGALFTVRAGGKETKATHHHRWLVRFTKEARDLQVVYLMRRGCSWRVGRCKLFRSDGVLHLGHRARLEGADAAWILLATKSKTDAWAKEQLVASEGIPQTCFKLSREASWLTQGDIDKFFKSVGGLDEEAGHILSDHNLDADFPFWSQAAAYERRGGTSLITLQSCNLLSGYMEVPVRTEGKKTEWSVLHTECKRHHYGRVYSLDVKPNPYYIADGIVTHNTIYSFRGSVPDAFLDPPIPDEQKIILPLSYRLPRVIKERAEKWISGVSRREEKPFEARDFEGEIVESDAYPSSWTVPDKVCLDSIEAAKSGRTSMILASCGFMLEPTVRTLRSMGATFHNPYRLSHGLWNPLRGGVDRLLDFCRPDRAVWGDDAHSHTWGSARSWFDVLDIKKSGLKRGSKALVKQRSTDDEWKDKPITLQDFIDMGIDKPPRRSDWQWLRQRLRTKIRPLFSYAFEVCERQGGPAILRKEPRIVVGTIHSVKGGQCSDVYLFPDLSSAAHQERFSGPAGEDAIRRMFYVGMTRAKEKLILCQPVGHCAEL